MVHLYVYSFFRLFINSFVNKIPSVIQSNAMQSNESLILLMINSISFIHFSKLFKKDKNQFISLKNLSVSILSMLNLSCIRCNIRLASGLDDAFPLIKETDNSLPLETTMLLFIFSIKSLCLFISSSWESITFS